MRKISPTSLLPIVGVLGLVGLALAGRPRSVGMPGPPAPGPREPDRWEYRILDFSSLVIDVRLADEEIREAEKFGVQKARSLEDKFNRLGETGWELVAYTPNAAVFKRPSN